MATPFHGWNGLIYVSGLTVLTGTNAWTIDIEKRTAEMPELGNDWVNRAGGQKAYSGTIAVWDNQDQAILFNAVDATIAVAWIIYPQRTVMTKYFNGNALFGLSAEGGTEGGVAFAVAFEGDGELHMEGYKS